MPNTRVSKNPGVVKGRLPLELYSGSDGMHVRTDENLQVFVPCGLCRPGANARGKTRENSKKWPSATFSTLSAPSIPAAYRLDYISTSFKLLTVYFGEPHAIFVHIVVLRYLRHAYEAAARGLYCFIRCCVFRSAGYIHIAKPMLFSKLKK